MGLLEALRVLAQAKKAEAESAKSFRDAQVLLEQTEEYAAQEVARGEFYAALDARRAAQIEVRKEARRRYKETGNPEPAPDVRVTVEEEDLYVHIPDDLSEYE